MKPKNNAIFVVVKRTYRFNVTPDKDIDEVRALIGGTLKSLGERKLISNPLLAKQIGIIGESFFVNVPDRGVGWENKTIRYAR